MMRLFQRVFIMIVLIVPVVSLGQKATVKSYKRPMQIVRKEKYIEISASFSEMFTNKFKHRLSSGFTCQIIMNVSLLEDGHKKPMAQSVVQTSILYDIWEESFTVNFEGPFKQKKMQIQSMQDIIDKCGSLNNLPLRPKQLLDSDDRKKYRLRVDITINPTSEVLRRKVREYLANPEGRSYVGSPRSFFGSFSKIFVSERDLQADAVYKYESQKFKL